jgi:hypothetical protein
MLTEWQYQRWTRALEFLREGRVIVFRSQSFPDRKGVAKMVRGRVRYRLFERMVNGLWILIWEKVVSEDDIAYLMELGWSSELGRPKDFFKRHRDA